MCGIELTRATCFLKIDPRRLAWFTSKGSNMKTTTKYLATLALLAGMFGSFSALASACAERCFQVCGGNDTPGKQLCVLQCLERCR